MVNEARAAYNRLVGTINTPNTEQYWKEFGFKGTLDREDINGAPLFQPAGYRAIGDRSFAPDPRKQDVRQFVDTITSYEKTINGIIQAAGKGRQA